MRRLALTVFAIALVFPSAVAKADDVGTVVLVSAQTGVVDVRFSPWGDSPVGSVAAADLGIDGTAEIVLGAAAGSAPEVATYRQDGSRITAFLAYDAAFRGGVNVAACDLDGDGSAEIVVGAQFGGGPHVRVFDGDGALVNPGFFAYDDTFRGGVNVACGDVDGDGVNEIITGAGLSGGPHVKVFTRYGELMYEAFNGSAVQNTGAFVATVDIDQNGDDEIIASSMGYDAGAVSVFDLRDERMMFRNAIPSTSAYGTPVFGFNGNIGTTTNGYVDASIAVTNDVGVVMTSLAPLSSTAPLRAAEIDGNIVVAISSTPLYENISGRAIHIDISEPRLTAYENGIPVNTFLVSTGVRGFDTPLGKTDVKAKLLWHDYAWYYSPNDARNYNLPNVKYNLRIYNHIYIHYAYWHNNFGERMSHGCVNVNYTNAEWIYAWADVSTSVNIVP